MSNLVAFLEGLGTDGHLQGLSPEDYVAAVSQLDVEPALRDALIARDADAIARLVRATPMMMVLAPADDRPADGDQPADKDGGDDKPAPDR